MKLNREAFQQILFNIEHIGSPEKVSLKLLQKTSNPDYSTDDVSEIISKEPTISAQILKIANSVHFSRLEPVKTIKQAVIKLGLSNIKSILFSIEMFGIFKGTSSSNGFKEKEFWKHSVAGAIIASKYAEYDSSLTDPDIVYVAALIRNLGVLAIRQFIPGEFDIIVKLMECDTLSFASASRAVLGASHRQIIYMIGLRWNLPRSIVEAIDDKNNICQDQTSESSQIKNAILFADDLLQVAGFAIWEPFYMPGNVDFHGIPCEDIFNEASTVVDKIFEELWT